MKIKLTKLNIAIITAATVLLLTTFFLGLTGARTLLAMFFLFTLPAYLILDLFRLEGEEKLFIGTFIGISLFSVSVFYVNRIIPSLRVSVLVFYAFIVLIWVVGKRLQKKQQQKAAVAPQTHSP